jgi:hypothetical protein
MSRDGSSVIDKEGHDITRGDEVEVGEPLAGDLHQHGFMGQVVSVDSERGVVCVCDRDGDCFDVDSYNVKLVA